MQPDPQDLDLSELARAAGVTPRTIRYYVQQGLLPSPGTRGPGTRYDRALLDRLQLIKVLQREHWPLSRIREHLEELDEEGVRREMGQRPALPHTLSDSALRYTRALLDRDSRGGAPSTPGRASPFAAPMSSAVTPGSADASLAPDKWQVTKSTWERIRLTNNVELSIRRPLTRQQNKLVDRLLEAARKILSEED